MAAEGLASGAEGGKHQQLASCRLESSLLDDKTENWDRIPPDSGKEDVRNWLRLLHLPRVTPSPSMEIPSILCGTISHGQVR